MSHVTENYPLEGGHDESIENRPIIDIGLRANRSRPWTPMYLLRQPADHIRTTYSVPKNTTRTISYVENNSRNTQTTTANTTFN